MKNIPANDVVSPNDWFEFFTKLGCKNILRINVKERDGARDLVVDFSDEDVRKCEIWMFAFIFVNDKEYGFVCRIFHIWRLEIRRRSTGLKWC